MQLLPLIIVFFYYYYLLEFYSLAKLDMRLYRLLLILGTKKEMTRQGDYFNRFFWLYSFSACVYFSFTHTQLRTLSSFFFLHLHGLLA